jgi:adenine deaminase
MDKMGKQLFSPKKYEVEVNQMQECVLVAQGARDADLVLTNTNLLNVFTQEIYPADILVAAGKIAAVVESGSGIGLDTLDCTGLTAVPGLIDAHVHIESSILTLPELVRLVVPRGVTTLLADPHEIANVMGINGIELLLQDADRLPIRVFLQMPSQVPWAPGAETTGGEIGLREIEEMLTWEKTVSLGEISSAVLVPPKFEPAAKAIATAKARRVVSGHAAGLAGRELNALISAGVYDDHECVSVEGAIERMRLGMQVIAREGTWAEGRNVFTLMQAITEHKIPSRNLMFCTDDKMPHEILLGGHLDKNIRIAIEQGVSPVEAIQMGTINAAQRFHLEGMIGSIAPGRLADIVLLSDVNNFEVEKVLFAGKVVAESGHLIEQPLPSKYPEWAVNTINVCRRVTSDDFLIHAPTEKSVVKARVIDTTKPPAIPIVMELPVENGVVVAPADEDVSRIAVVERHKGTGNIGQGFIKGFHVPRGALASSISHDNHNIVVVGTDTKEMAVAVNHLIATQGGIVAVLNGEVIANLPLLFGGLMSVESYEQVITGLDQLEKAATERLGCEREEPIMTLTGLVLPMNVAITDMGFVAWNEEKSQFEILDIVLEGD